MVFERKQLHTQTNARTHAHTQCSINASY